MRRRFFASGMDKSSAGGSDDPIGDALRADAKAYWKLEEASGTRVDATGRGNDLTQFNTLDNTAGKIGNAAHFLPGLISTEGYLRRDHTPDLSNYGHDLNLAFWIKMNALASICVIAKWDSQTVEEYAVEIYEDSENLGNYQFIVSTGIAGYAVVPTYIVEGQWYFVEMYTKSSEDECGIAINGGSFVTSAMGGLTESTVQFSIGALTGAPISATLGGDVDEVGIWHRILTADERAYLYNSGDGRTLYP